MPGRNRYGSRSSPVRNAGFSSFIQSILPRPPDVRNVIVMHTPEHKVIPMTAQQNNPVPTNNNIARKAEISCANTTIIGDYIAVVFPEGSTSWWVQAYGNATLGSTTMLIKEGLVSVNRKYIFIQLGGNQLRTVDANKVFGAVIDMTVVIRERSPNSKIYFIGVLPRPIDNQDIKPYIVKFNRWLMQALNSANELFERVIFLPVHLKFINGNQPRAELFNQEDRCTLNAAGAFMFKKQVFELAGFVKNT